MSDQKKYSMFVVKRDGRTERVSFDKITQRIEGICKQLNLTRIDPISVAQSTISGLYDGMTTEELDIFASLKSSERYLDDPQYNDLAAGLCISNMHKKTLGNFVETTKVLYNNVDNDGKHCPLVNKDYYDYVLTNADQLNKMINYEKDFMFDFFAIKTLEQSYLKKVNNKIVETPQDLFMRVAIALYHTIEKLTDDEILQKINTAYTMMTDKYFTHGSPTLFNAGTNRQQLSSCFLKDTEVLTINDGIKYIQDVNIDDQVITHRGNIKRVTQLHTNLLNNRVIYKLKPYKSKPIYVTGNHRFLTIDESGTVMWKAISELRVDDYIAIPSKNQSLPVSKFYDYNVTLEFVELLAMILVNGDISNEKLYIKGFKQDLQNIQEYFYTLASEITNDEEFLIIHDVDFISMIQSIYRNGLPNSIFTWDMYLTRKFLTTIAVDSVIHIDNSKFIDQLYHLGRSNGLQVYYLDSRTLEIGTENSSYIRIASLEITNLDPVYVYTLGVEDDHSYNVEGVICENCFLLGMDDSLDDIGETTIDCWKISKWAGGIGVHLQDIRAKGSLIRGTNGPGSGVVPLARVLNESANYVNQGSKRNGAIALYIEVFHADVYDFCNLRKPTGDEKLRARDIFLALWVCDLFFKRVKSNGMWSLFCPDECPGLTDTYGDEFEALYQKYEQEKKYKKQVRAMDLLHHIMTAQIETGMPYICAKDTANRLSNQKNIGIIKSSNLCAEIYEVSTQKETAVCNLGSICLPKFLVKVDDKLEVDYKLLIEVAKVITYNLDRVIDINYYPIKKARQSNMRHRPIGIGIQGLADVYCLLEIPFDSEEANTINKKLCEAIYYGACTASNQLAKTYGPYETYEGSPFSQGKLQFHLLGMKNEDLLLGLDWDGLVDSIKTHGMRNSLLTAFMPTASTSQIMGNNECFEPYTTNVYTRTTQAGEFIIINRHLMETLIKHGLWNKQIKDELMFDNGSIQHIDEIPQKIKEIYKTAYEMKMKPCIDQAIGRSPFCDQGQSLNLYCATPDFTRLKQAFLYGWKNNLKTLMYYLRSRPNTDAVKFGIDPEVKERLMRKRGLIYMPQIQEEKQDSPTKSDGECLVCQG